MFEDLELPDLERKRLRQIAAPRFTKRKGYRQEGNDMVCNNCEQHFRTDLVNVVKGGCNPAPLRRQQVGETVVIAVNDIERGAGYFKTAVN